MSVRIHLPALALCVSGMVAAAPAWAKASAQDVEQLGKKLTCVGAEKAGSPNGVPEFTGKWLGTPPGVNYTPHVGQHPVDPYADEKPLFSITAENMAQYAERLTEGQKLMLTKFPQTFRIPVYPGHRDFRYPDAVCAAAKKNALSAEVTPDGLGVQNAVMGAMPFPIPKNGTEAVMNTLMPYRAFTEQTLRDSASVLASGAVVWGRADNMAYSLATNPKSSGQPLKGILSYSWNRTLLPERDKGGVSVIAEPANYSVDKRLGWSYDPGTRRVRQLPEYGYDQPLAGTGGKMTIDSERLFNGSLERYDWKLVGKREVYIPANTYKLHGKNVKYADLIQKNGHANPDYMRYELRRVWEVQATLKPGYRHLYGKRVLFLDEDTGQAVLSDYYDARGQLWQHAMINSYYAFDAQVWHTGTSFYHDLVSRSYVAYNMFQERPKGPILNKGDMDAAMFTPEAARNAGM